MSTIFHELRIVSPATYKWKIKVRVIRFWRGVSRDGQQFKGFNLLLLDDKNCRMHAFVPGNISDEMDDKLIVGNLYIISNFTVKEYKPYERFRCIRNDKQIIFSSYTKFQQIEENETLIQQNEFDFFDLGDLEEVAKQNVYLTDIVGILQKDLPIKQLINCNGEAQIQQKFRLTDGRTTVNVTFWDKFAEDLEEKLQDDLQEPIIMIIASAKINLWEGNIEIGHVSSSKFYLNYTHHSVQQLRQITITVSTYRLNTPLFSKQEFSSQKAEIVKQFNLQDISNLSVEYAKKEVICDIKIWNVDNSLPWFFCTCTSCYREIKFVDGKHNCVMCNNDVPHPLKKFRIQAECYDDTGEIDIILEDREVQTLTGKTVYDFLDEEPNPEIFPDMIKTIEDKEYRIKILVKQTNIDKLCKSYLATDIYEKNAIVEDPNMDVTNEVDEVENTANEPSPSYHLDGMSQLSFVSPDVSKKKKTYIPRPTSSKKMFKK